MDGVRCYVHPDGSDSVASKLSRWTLQRVSMFPCIGIYTVDGVACGLYGRMARTPIVNYSAVDVGVLVDG